MPAALGNKVRISYTGTLADGAVFASTPEGETLTLQLGEYRVLPAVEDAIVGMEEGESRSIRVAASDAYGDYLKELIATLPRDALPEGAQAEVGAMLQIRLPGGEEMDVTVTEVGSRSITVDGNHPLAGRELRYDVTLVEIC